jgi:hypothetical protein
MNTERKNIEMAEAIFFDKYDGRYASWSGNTVNPDGSVTLRDKWGNFLKTITPEELKEYEAQESVNRSYH